MNRTQCDSPAAPADPARPSGLDRVAAVLPGMRVAAPKRNALVLLGYLLVSLAVTGYLLRVF